MLDGFRSALAVSAAAAVGIAIGCGAERSQAPAPVTQPATLVCSELDGLMPRVMETARSGKLAGMGEVFDSLSTGDRAGAPPPMNAVLEAVIGTLVGFAREPAEAGAPEGEKCATPPPAIASANSLCELQRGLDSLVHEGRALRLLETTDPLLEGVLGYVTGRPPASAVPHYELAQIVGSICQQSAVCELNDQLDLGIALLQFATTAEGEAALRRLEGLLAHPSLAPFLTNSGQQYGGEAGVVAIARTLLTTILGMQSTAELDTLPLEMMPAELRTDFQAAIGDLKLLLDPARSPNVVGPLKRTLNCVKVQDPDLQSVRMLYRLTFDAKLPAFGLDRLVGALRIAREADPRSSVFHLARLLLEGVRADEAAVLSAATVCEALFADGNAQKALPAMAELYAAGFTRELVCAADVLLFGCAGGVQPACAPAP